MGLSEIEDLQSTDSVVYIIWLLSIHSQAWHERAKVISQSVITTEYWTAD